MHEPDKSRSGSMYQLSTQDSKNTRNDLLILFELEFYQAFFQNKCVLFVKFVELVQKPPGNYSWPFSLQKRLSI